MDRKTTALVSLLVVIILVLAIVAYVYATRAPTGTTPGGQAAPLVVGTTDDEITFDPADSYDSFSINFIQNTMAMLLTYVPGTTDLTTTGALLTSVPTLANGGITANELTYTLHIRANATFENGVAINSAVVKYSIDRVVKLNGEPAFLLDPIVGASAYWNAPAGTQKDSAWANYTAQGVQVVDPLTVRINLNRKWSPFDSLLAFTITAPVDPNSFTNDKFYPNVIVSSGPYRMSRYIPHQRYELQANPTYFGPAPAMAKVTVVRYTTAVDLKLAIQTGEIDIAYRSLLPTDYNTLKQNANLRTAEGESPVIRYLVFNVCDPLGVASLWCPRATIFADPRLRQALAYATDRTDIATSAYASTVSPLFSLVPEGMFGHEDVFSTHYGSSPNVAAARALLQAAGYDTTNKLPITLWYTPSHYGDPEIFVAQALKRAWEATGMVTVTIDLKEWADYKAAWRSGAFDVFLLGWFPDYFDSDDYVFPFLHSASGGTASFGNWYKNATMDAKIDAEAATADPTQRTQLFDDIQQGLAYDVPYLPLFQTKQVVVFRPNVSGIVLDPIQFFRYFTITVS